MRILGIEPSSVILSQKSSWKTWEIMPKEHRKKLKQKGMV